MSWYNRPSGNYVINMSNFTEQDAELLIQTAQSAPLQNMRHAQAVSELLTRFQQFFAETKSHKCEVEAAHEEDPA